ncbi:MAG TPA: GTPase [Planctomycetaceae bacterium]|nr:GTPase [Planctomycetaceae bacterium]
MISRRSAVLGALVFVPVIVYGILGGFALWETGLLRKSWWVGPLFWVGAWVLGQFWRARHPMRQGHTISIPAHWTPRDEQAALVVREFQQKVDQLTPQQLTDPAFYQQEAQKLAVALARNYFPDAEDAFSSLTVPEVLAALRLALDDLEQWLLTSLPGSRLLSIKQWQMLQHAPKWIRRIQNTTWAASILINPLNIARLWTSRVAAEPITTELQTEVLAVIYLRFIREIGFYLIEMNSGRLRGGADAYRRHFQADAARSSERGEKPPAGPPTVQTVNVALVGQVSSGKSSLINALTGAHRAAVDVLPKTREVQRYQAQFGTPPVRVTLLDTPGYGEAGASAQQLEEIREALLESHAVLVVMDAHSPAREADRRTLQDVENWFQSQPQLKPPPKIGVVTHIDLLRPALEWSPPYEWREPVRPKEHSIHDAVDYVRELFGVSLAAVVPVCSDVERKRSWGVLEGVIPALISILNEAQSGALLRAYEQDLDRDHVKILMKQLQRFGMEVVRGWIEERVLPPSSRP